MWTPTTREQYSRTALRYETDLTDAEWAVIEPHMPRPAKLGRPPDWAFREIIDAIFYVLRGGIPWRLIPTDLPPWPTVYRWFAAWRDSGLFETINHALVMSDRERVGREASPSAAILDSQSVKTTESGGPRGYDAGKKVKGRKRHALVDTDGRALLLFAHPADTAFSLSRSCIRAVRSSTCRVSASTRPSNCAISASFRARDSEGNLDDRLTHLLIHTGRSDASAPNPIESIRRTRYKPSTPPSSSRRPPEQLRREGQGRWTQPLTCPPL